MSQTCIVKVHFSINPCGTPSTYHVKAIPTIAAPATAKIITYTIIPARNRNRIVITIDNPVKKRKKY